MSGILRGKCEEVDGSSLCSSAQEPDDEVFSCDSADSVDSVDLSTSDHFTGECLKLHFRLGSRCVVWSILGVSVFIHRAIPALEFEMFRLICKTGYHLG